MKILYISHSPSLNTGFGQVSRHISQRLHARGAEIVCLGSGQTESGLDAAAFPFKIKPVPPQDHTGWTLLPGMIREEKPDLIFMNFELSACVEWLNLIFREKTKIPLLLYYSIEGFPIYRPWQLPIKLADGPVTYTRFGMERTRLETGVQAQYLYHGVDHDAFHGLPGARRREIRDKLGWSGRFIVSFVGVNRLSKQQPKLIEAAAVLKQQGIDDVRIYLHCHPFDKHRFGGWHLPDIAADLGVADRILFKDGPASDLLADPARKPGKQAALPTASLVEKYNATDLYLHASRVEGFGLPLIEAMACGLPVAHTDDGSVMNEICGELGYRIPPSDHIYSTFGARYFVLSAEKIAETILHFRETLRDRDCLEKWRQAGPERAKNFDWDETADGFMNLAEHLVRKKPTHQP
jgi:glycosyltransferase involved in cell wall biosynthesis